MPTTTRRDVDDGFPFSLNTVLFNRVNRKLWNDFTSEATRMKCSIKSLSLFEKFSIIGLECSRRNHRNPRGILSHRDEIDGCKLHFNGDVIIDWFTRCQRTGVVGWHLAFTLFRTFCFVLKSVGVIVFIELPAFTIYTFLSLYLFSLLSINGCVWFFEICF